MARTETALNAEPREWAATRELAQSLMLIGMLLAPMGVMVGLGLLAVRIFAG